MSKTMTVKELKKSQRKIQREEFKIIESHLHPSPELIRGIEICHEHKGRSIIFSVWRGDKRVNYRQLKYPRTDILYDKHFYNHNSLDFKWLMEEIEDE